MTWAQGTFAFGFGILVPAVGILGAMRLKREERNWIKGFTVAAGATLLALIGSCVVAVLLFPRYPHQQVPELLANAFTFPGVLVGIGSIWFVPRARAASRNFCAGASIIVAVLYIGGLAACYELFTWPFRKALPWTATDIHEWYWSETLLPDYSYYLKAKVTENQFRTYVARFGLTPHAPDRAYSESSIWLNWESAPESDGGWWNPSDSLDTTFVREGHDTWTFAKFEQGYLYLASLNH